MNQQRLRISQSTTRLRNLSIKLSVLRLRNTEVPRDVRNCPWSVGNNKFRNMNTGLTYGQMQVPYGTGPGVQTEKASSSMASRTSGCNVLIVLWVRIRVNTKTVTFSKRNLFGVITLTRSWRFTASAAIAVCAFTDMSILPMTFGMMGK